MPKYLDKPDWIRGVGMEEEKKERWIDWEEARILILLIIVAGICYFFVTH